MKLSEIHQSNNKFYGYRTVSIYDAAERVAKYGISVSETTETYWSYDPILYIYHPGPNKNSEYSNLIEVLFDRNDDGLCGLGDGNALYQYLTINRPTQELDKIINKLPKTLQQQFIDLKSDIVNDKEYAEDWSLAGILPVRFKPRMIKCIKDASRYLEWYDRHPKDEFTFIGPLTFETQSYIVGVFMFEFDKGKYSPSKWYTTAKTIIPLYIGKESRLINIIKTLDSYEKESTSSDNRRMAK